MTEPTTILQSALQWEREIPNHTFMVQPMGGSYDNTKSFTWAETLDGARRMAAWIKAKDWEPGSMIALCSKNCAWWVMADLAIWMAGHVTVPIYPTLDEGTVRYILEHSEAKMLFVGKLDAVWDVMKPGVPDGIVQVAFPLSPEGPYEQWDHIVGSTEPLTEVADRAPDELATIIYTSGSTGRPKGVMHDFKNMFVCTRGLSNAIQLVDGDRYLSYLPMAHGMERWLGECSSIYNGKGELYFAESLDTFGKDLQRARPTVFLSVPRLWSKFQLAVFAKQPPKKLEFLLKVPILNGIVKKKILTALGLADCRMAGSGSAPIPKELIEWYKRLGLELLEGYGMTENFNYSHISKPGEGEPGFVGTPYDDVQARIAEDGEIQVLTPGAMLGYYKQPEQTKETFTEDGWLKTGDRGEIDAQGRLKITGRTKEIFKTSKGKYVAPAPIENKLNNHPRIELACVGGLGYPQPSAVIKLSEEAWGQAQAGGKDAITKDLEAHVAAVNAQLPNFERLDFVAVVPEDWLPENGFLTPTMKIKRASIEKAYGQFNDDWYGRKTKVVWHEPAS
jgi:long-chain acyl-CoA synthetase